MKALIMKNRHHFKMILYIVVFIVCFGLAMGLLSINSLQNLYGSKGKASLQVQTYDNQAWMSVEATSDTINAGDTVTFTVMADSFNTDINGYDVLFQFDPQHFEIVEVNSLLPIFDIYTFPNEGYLSITGTKKLSVETTAVLKNSVLLSVQARAKGAGMSQVSIVPEIRMERSKMVDTNAEIITPAIAPAVTVNIR